MIPGQKRCHQGTWLRCWMLRTEHPESEDTRWPPCLEREWERAWRKRKRSPAWSLSKLVFLPAAVCQVKVSKTSNSRFPLLATGCYCSSSSSSSLRGPICKLHDSYFTLRMTWPCDTTPDWPACPVWMQKHLQGLVASDCSEHLTSYSKNKKPHIFFIYMALGRSFLVLI